MDFGVWRLSDAGRAFVEKRIDKWANSGKSADQMLSDLQSFQHECIYSLECVELVCKIGEERKNRSEPMRLSR